MRRHLVRTPDDHLCLQIDRFPRNVLLLQRAVIPSRTQQTPHARALFRAHLVVKASHTHAGVVPVVDGLLVLRAILDEPLRCGRCAHFVLAARYAFHGICGGVFSFEARGTDALCLGQALRPQRGL
jgi:hypothetical protein